MAMKVRHDVLPYWTNVDSTLLTRASKLVATGLYGRATQNGAFLCGDILYQPVRCDGGWFLPACKSLESDPTGNLFDYSVTRPQLDHVRVPALPGESSPFYPLAPQQVDRTLRPRRQVVLLIR